MAEPRLVPPDDPRIALIVGMVANGFGHRLPFHLASEATQYGRRVMARELLATLDDHQKEQDAKRRAECDHDFYTFCGCCGIEIGDYFESKEE